MPDPVVEGEPLQLGQVAVGVDYHITPVVNDGTRRVSELTFVDPGFKVFRNDAVLQDQVVTEDQVGQIPTIATPTGTFQESALEEGLWIALSDPWLSRVPVTPGDDYYETRTILDEHAVRFVNEHNPANLRLTKPNVVRIEHLSHELSTADRMRSANTDEYVRERLGYIWWRNEQFRQDAVWHARA